MFIIGAILSSGVTSAVFGAIDPTFKRFAEARNEYYKEQFADIFGQAMADGLSGKFHARTPGGTIDVEIER